MRLTADLLLNVHGYLNSNQERECNLRGLKVPAIENLAVMQDQYNCIDLTDNEVKKLDNFPVMKRIESLLLANNHISKLSTSLGKQLPSLKNLVLTNNRINHLNELKHLVKCTNLKHLSCLDNPVSTHSHYRLYVIYYLSSGVEPTSSNKNEEGDVLPNLKTLDFQKITVKERLQANELFTSQVGRELLEQIKIGYAEQVQKDAQANMMVGSRGLSNQPAWMTQAPAGDSAATASGSGDPAKSTKQSMGALTAEQKAQVRQAIEGAKTKVEIDRIELQLQTGTFSFFKEVATAVLKEAPAPPNAPREAPKAPAPPAKEAPKAPKAPPAALKPPAKEEEVVAPRKRGRSASVTEAEADVPKEAVQKSPTKVAKKGGRDRSSSAVSETAEVEEKPEKKVAGRRGRSVSVAESVDVEMEEEPVAKKGGKKTPVVKKPTAAALKKAAALKAKEEAALEAVEEESSEEEEAPSKAKKSPAKKAPVKKAVVKKPTAAALKKAAALKAKEEEEGDSDVEEEVPAKKSRRGAKK